MDVFYLFYRLRLEGIYKIKNRFFFMFYIFVLNKEIFVKILNIKLSFIVLDVYVLFVEVNLVYLYVILENLMIEKFLMFDKLY